MKTFYTTIFLSLLFFPLLYSQDCTGYHQYHCTYADYTFFYSRQSKSTLFKRGQSSEFRIITYGGEEYYVAICAHRKFGDVQFKIMEANNERTLIYDNSQDNYATSVIFTNDVTRDLIIEVTVPPGSKNDNDRRCVGMLVEFKKIE